MHDHWHAMLGKTIGGIPEYRLDNLKDLGDIHQTLHEEMARALGVARGL
jgi:hypothetical protein